MQAHFGIAHGQDDRALGTRVQAAHRRHARSAGHHHRRTAAGGRRARAGLRSRGDARVARGLFGAKIQLADKSYDALKGADALAVVTEWNEFREPDFPRMRKLMQCAGDLRRPEHLQSRADAGAGLHLLLDRPLMAGLRGTLARSAAVSVVMPVYNEQATIEEIIGRVLAVPIRIELIVVDDGSKDGTRDILDARCSSSTASRWSSRSGTRARARRSGAASRRCPATSSSSRTPTSSTPRGVPAADRAHLPGPRRRRVRLAVPGPAPRVPVHALSGQPVADAADQRALQHDAQRHGNLLQGDAHRGAPVDDAASPTASASSRS